MSEYFDDSLYETSEHRQTAPEQMPQMTGREKHKKSGAGKAVALVLVCALVSGCMGVGGAFLGGRLVRQGQPETVLSDGVSTVMKGVIWSTRSSPRSASVSPKSMLVTPSPSTKIRCTMGLALCTTSRRSPTTITG